MHNTVSEKNRSIPLAKMSPQVLNENKVDTGDDTSTVPKSTLAVSEFSKILGGRMGAEKGLGRKLDLRQGILKGEVSLYH